MLDIKSDDCPRSEESTWISFANERQELKWKGECRKTNDADQVSNNPRRQRWHNKCQPAVSVFEFNVFECHFYSLVWQTVKEILAAGIRWVVLRVARREESSRLGTPWTAEVVRTRRIDPWIAALYLELGCKTRDSSFTNIHYRKYSTSPPKSAQLMNLHWFYRKYT